MRYLSVAQIAKIWNVSERSVRNYCANGRVNGAFLTGKTWNIPEDAKKPQKLPNTPIETEELGTLASKLVNQKKKKNYHGLYDYVVINLTYSSCRMASNRLTRGQVETIFKKGIVNCSF